MKHQTPKKPLRACFLYYQAFHSLAYREAMALKEVGFDVNIVCLRSAREEKTYEDFNGLKIFRIQVRSAAEKNPITYFFRLMLFFVKSVFLVSYLQLKNRYTLIHVTSPPDIMVFAALLPKLLGARIILDIHDIGPELFMRKLNVSEKHPIITLLKYLERLSSAFADHVIVVTDLWRDRVVSRSVRPEKCTVLLNVPDDKIFTFHPP